jgi:hypothetical protein
VGGFFSRNYTNFNGLPQSYVTGRDGRFKFDWAPSKDLELIVSVTPPDGKTITSQRDCKAGDQKVIVKVNSWLLED